jgi:hypothetical protein
MNNPINANLGTKLTHTERDRDTTHITEHSICFISISVLFILEMEPMQKNTDSHAHHLYCEKRRHSHAEGV